MALRWDISNCKDVEAIKTDEEWPVTNALIWSTLVLQIGTITDKNIDEFCERMSICQKCFGALMVNPKGEDRWITRKDIEKRIGLRTNVTTESKSKFNNEVIRALRRDALAVLEREEIKREEVCES